MYKAGSGNHMPYNYFNYGILTSKYGLHNTIHKPRNLVSIEHKGKGQSNRTYLSRMECARLSIEPYNIPSI